MKIYVKNTLGISCIATAIYLVVTGLFSLTTEETMYSAMASSIHFYGATLVALLFVAIGIYLIEEVQ